MAVACGLCFIEIKVMTKALGACSCRWVRGSWLSAAPRRAARRVMTRSAAPATRRAARVRKLQRTQSCLNEWRGPLRVQRHRRRRGHGRHGGPAWWQRRTGGRRRAACNPTARTRMGTVSAMATGTATTTTARQPGAYDYPGDAWTTTARHAGRCTAVRQHDHRLGGQGRIRRGQGHRPVSNGDDRRQEVGVIVAKYVMADGKPGNERQVHGLLPAFGANVPRAKDAHAGLVERYARLRTTRTTSHGWRRHGTRATPVGLPIDSPRARA